MKKLILALVVCCLLFVAVIGCAKQGEAPAPAETAEPAETAAPAEAAPEAQPTAEPETPAEAEEEHIDMEALYALYPADMVYATVGEREITWGEYYEWLGSSVLSAESYMSSMKLYGMELRWDDDYTNDATMAEYILSLLSDNLRAFTGIELFAAQNGVSITEEELAEKRAEDIRGTLGEDATEEDWAELLVANFMTDNLYRAQAKAQLELTRTQEALYGLHGEKVTTAQVQHYIEDKGYLRCNHILFLTLDMENGGSLDEETIAAKKSRAEEIAAELQAIENREELLARFAELKDELCEDSGKLYYPDGYIFTPGTMVEIFEETTRALRDFEVSAPVLSNYGYHVIIRLPIDADTALDDGGTVGEAAASELMAADLDAVVDALDFTLAPGVEPVNLLDFLTRPQEK